MKILFITDLYPIESGESNTPLTLHNFVFEWIKQGHQVDVIKPNFIFNSFLRKKPFYKDGFYNYNGVKIFNVNYLTPFCFSFLKKIPNEFDFTRYDVVVAHMPSGILFANKLVKIIQKPLICGVHISDIEILTNPLYKFYFRSQLKDAYKCATKIACRSFVLQKKFNSIMPEFADKTFVASSGVPVSKQEAVNGKREKFLQDIISEKPTLQPSNHLTLSVLTCANLIKRKNIDKLILAMKNLEGFRLKIIGDGPELKRLKKLACKVGFQYPHNDVEFVGRLAYENVLDEMRNSDIFILPSINETFGMVYLEAMASGCVTICTKNDGIDGIIKDSENGFLCEATIEGIKDTLLRVKEFSAIEKIIKNSLQTVENYTPEKCAENYIKNINYPKTS